MAERGRGSTQDLAFFSVVAAAQLVWGVVSMAEAPRWWLALGAAGNLVVVATWVVSRTAGLPVGDYAGITLPVGFPDALATALEAVIVAGATVLLVRGHGPVRGLARSPRVAVAAAVVAAAQLAIAREHGYPSWPQLVAEVRARTTAPFQGEAAQRCSAGSRPAEPGPRRT